VFVPVNAQIKIGVLCPLSEYSPIGKSFYLLGRISGPREAGVDLILGCCYCWMYCINMNIYCK